MDIHWQPQATIATLKKRALYMASIRAFFNARDYLEVETPIMGKYGVTDPYLSNIKADFRTSPYVLQTSPEYHMKRLLAAGFPSIFQISKVFRDDELGRWHNPEFTLLEWYKKEASYDELIQEVDELLQMVLNTPPARRMSYQAAFLEHCGVDPFHTTIATCQAILKKFELDKVIPLTETDLDLYLFLLMSHVIEPTLASDDRPTVITHFPASQAALALIENERALRFEFYYQGVELANGFQELQDSALQLQRFEADRSKRKHLNLEQPAVDLYLLAALKAGLPACSGVALGLDRLFALSLQLTSLTGSMAFDFGRA